jgi:hypothetical protein
MQDLPSRIEPEYPAIDAIAILKNAACGLVQP